MSHLTYPNLFILTGAGLSAESGVPTFRGSDGLWEGYRVEDVATPEAFARDPEQVHRFYNQRRAALRTVVPNAAHRALVQLEHAWPGGFLHVTQNIDDLNERAGAQKLLHLHGQLKKVRCLHCRLVFPWEGDLDTSTPCPGCERTETLRPDIVWFGEMPYHIEEITRALSVVDYFICIGSSGVVYPAAGLARMAAENGAARLIEINLETTGISHDFTEQRLGPASIETPRLVEELLTSLDRNPLGRNPSSIPDKTPHAPSAPGCQHVAS